MPCKQGYPARVSEADEEVILISAEGQVVRTKLESIATRNDGSSQGVRVFITNVKGTFLGMSESEEASKRR